MSGSRPLAGLLIERAINRVLALDVETREALCGLEDVTVRLHVAGLDGEYVLRPGPDGVRVERASPGAGDGAGGEGPEVRISGPPISLARMAASFGQPGFEPPEQVRVSGDLGALQRLRSVLAGLDPDWEEPLARVVGDTAAHQIGRLARDARGWLRRSATTAWQDVGEYLVEESRVAPARGEIEGFAAAVEGTRDDVERLAKRIERLEERTRRGRAGP